MTRVGPVAQAALTVLVLGAACGSVRGGSGAGNRPGGDSAVGAAIADEPRGGMTGAGAGGVGGAGGGADASAAVAGPGPSPDTRGEAVAVRPDLGLDLGPGNDVKDAALDASATTASCAAGGYPMCLDFESGNIPAPWRAPANANLRIEQGHAAHGQYAMHVSNLRTKPSVMVSASALTGIKDVLWGRYYLYLSPGAPWGHGALVKVYDSAATANWYELGFESNSYIGLWILGAGGREKYMRSQSVIPGNRWICVEFLFDGATPSVGRHWSDGVEVPFPVDRMAGTDPLQSYVAPVIVKAGQFKNFQIGIEFYHGASLVSCPMYPPFRCPSYNSDVEPTITDMWIDDVALDTKRIGCL